MQQSQNVVDTIVELIKGKVMDAALNNSDAIGSTIASLLKKSNQAKAFLKSMDWSADDFGQTVQEFVKLGAIRYSNREHFAKTEEERFSVYSQNFEELLGYSCLDSLERRVLAARLAGYNNKEIHSIFGLKDRFSVEDLNGIYNAACEKFQQATRIAGVGVIGGSIEPSSNVDLEARAKELERK